MAGSEGLIYWGVLGIVLISIAFLVFSTSQVSGKIDSIEKISRENSKRLLEIQKEYSKLTENYETLESSLNYLSYESSKSFNLLGLKISSLEKEIQNIRDNVEDLSASLKDMRDKEYSNEISLNGLKNYINNLDEKFDGLWGTIFDLKSSIDSLKSDVKSNSSEINSLKSLSLDLEKRLKYLEDKRVVSVDEKIRELKREMNSLFRMIDIGGKDPVVAPFVILIVKKGDTILNIAKAFGVSVKDILEVNNITDPRKLMVGDKLKIPVSLKDVITLPVESLRKGDIVKGMDESGWIRFKVDGDIRAVMPGRVEEVRSGYIRLYHGNEVYTSYKFSGKAKVREGNWVKSGQIIGECHGYLDFALLINNEPRDPFKYIFDKLGEFSATFYTEWEDGILPEQASFRVTRSGNLVREWWTVASDPKVIPLGSYIYIPQLSRMPGGGVFHVEDVGSAIKQNKIDIYVGDMLLAIKLWKKDVTVYVMRQNR